MNHKRIFVLIIAFAVVWGTASQPTVLPGDIEVSAIGAASYTIPIEVVPGTNGLQPNLAIVYNSMAGLGIAGQKWTLQGISSITRVPQSRFYDGNILPIAFDTTDRFALNGNRMLLFSGNSYHANGATYCFEIEDFSRITKVVDGNEFYFKQTLADGTIIEYGRGGHSEYMLDGNVCMAWMVSRIIDIHGNYMTYVYKQEGGEIWINKIDYTFLADNTPSYARVSFDYSTMTAPNDSYVGGYTVRQSKLLTGITVTYNNQQVRKYLLTYDNGMQSERLSSIKLYGATNQFLTSTSIHYDTPSPSIDTNISYSLLAGGYYVVPGNYTGDRIYDLFLVKNESPGYASSIITNSSVGSLDSSYNISNIFLPTTAFGNMNACDINGDGIDEVVYTTYNTVHAIDVNASTNTPSSTLLFPLQGSYCKVLYGDFDGDGKTEIVSFEPATKTLYSFGIEDISNPTCTLALNYIICQAGDFDGDGKTDIALTDGLFDNIYSYNLRTHRWELTETYLLPNSANYYFLVGDFNGDGLSDMLFLKNNETVWKVAIRHGRQNWTITEIPELNGTHQSTGSLKPTYEPVIFDINGDGKSDILQTYDGNYARYIVSMGCYEDEFQYSGYGTLTFATGQRIGDGRYSMGDFDGNGIADLIFFDPNNTGQTGSVKYFSKDHLPAYFANHIEDAAGMEVKLEYSTISMMPYRYFGINMNRMPFPLVKNLIVSNGLQGYDTTSYYYGDAQYDAGKQSFLGFSLFGAKNRNRFSETFFSRLYNTATTNFAVLMPDSVVNFVTTSVVNINNRHYSGGHSHFVQPEVDRLVSRTANLYRSVSRINADGSTSFLPYALSSTSCDYLKNTKTENQTALNNGNWRVATQETRHGYTIGSTSEPCRKYVSHTYTTVTLPNGVTVIKPNKTTTIQYNSTSNANARLDTVEYTYSSTGMLSSKKHTDNGGLSVTDTYTYNTFGLPTVVTTTPLGATARYVTLVYDNTYRFNTARTDHAGNKTKKSYDPATGLCLSETDINGLVTQHAYDALGRLTQTTYPDATSKSIVYYDNSTDFTDACCHTTVTRNGRPECRTYFDCLGRKTHSYVAGQGYIDIVYNSKGQIAKQSEVPYSNLTVPYSYKKWKEFQYDQFDRIIYEFSNYTENTYTYRPDNSDYRYNERVVDKLGAETTKYFDAAGRVSEVHDEGGTITYVYDRVNQDGTINDRTRIVTGNNTTIIVADSRGNRRSLSDPDAGTATCTYNAWGELLTQTNAKGDVTTMTYDNQGRMNTKVYSNGNTSETFAYNYGTAAPLKGKIIQVNRNNMLYQSFNYDNIGRLSSATKYIDGTAYTHEYSYNINGQLYTTEYPSGYVLRNEYDNCGRLKYLKDHNSGIAIYTVDSRNIMGLPNICWFGNETGVEYTYNAWGMVTQIKYGYQEFNDPFADPLGRQDGEDSVGNRIDINPYVPSLDDMFEVGNQYSVLQYTYNNNGYITCKKDTKTSQQEDYSYDVLGRLTSFTVNNTQTVGFTYSDNGNLATNSRLGSDCYTYDSDRPHAVTSVIDNNGALPTTQCNVTYNSRNRPSSISENGWSIDLSYGEGLQREKAVLKNGNTAQCTTYFISKDSEREIKPTFSRYIDYIYADGRIVALHVHNTTANADSVYYVQTDLLGSWDRIVDGNKNVVQSSHFDPWGNRMSASDWSLTQDGSNLPFHRGFTGHEHYYRFGIINMNARLYDPVIARFFSPDPQVQNPYSTQGFNRYTYCGNNPVMYVDENGEVALWAAMLIGAVVVGGINLGIHASQKHVQNFWYGVAYFGQGAVAGAIIGATWWYGIGLLSSYTTPILVKTSIVAAKTIDIGSTFVSIKQDSENALDVLKGRYYFDEKIGHGYTQALTRYSIELPQTWLGYNYTQLRNASGKIDRVDYLGGGIYSTDEYASNRQGVTIGSFINMEIYDGINGDFSARVLSDPLFMHEYGHTFDSQLFGVGYLPFIGVQSGLSAWLDLSKHREFWTERRANRWAKKYFGHYYYVDWNSSTGEYSHYSPIEEYYPTWHLKKQ